MPRGRTSSTQQRRRLPLDAGERKKLLILAGLGVLCVIVVAVQLAGGNGPATAEAAPAGGIATVMDFEAVLAKMRGRGGAASGKSASQDTFTVDQALELFLGDTRPASVPVESFPSSVFGLPHTGNEPDEIESSRKWSEENTAAGTSDETADTDPLLSALEQIELETVLVSPRNRAAILNGQVLHSGETLCGFRIDRIEPGEVTLSRAGREFTLTLD